MPSRLTPEQNLADFIEAHGDRYDYSKVIYKRNNETVEIICPIHGVFQQRPDVHKRGMGCPDCSSTKGKPKPRITTDEWVARAKSIHGDTYDYSKVVYKKAAQKVEIICRDHGSFWQIPGNHTACEQGCDKCGGTADIPFEEFQERATKMHDGFYSYDPTLYTRASDKAGIICPVHGTFMQIATDHMNVGIGCIDCAGVARKTNEEFIAEASTIHGRFYDYTKTAYNAAFEHVIITCPTHGDFSMMPHNHTFHEQDCPKCMGQMHLGENEWLTFMGIGQEGRKQIIWLDTPNGKKHKKPDGIDWATKTVYEYYGDYWHGNPIHYNPSDLNEEAKKTFGQLYDATMQRKSDIEAAGYTVVFIWESDWLELKGMMRREGLIETDKQGYIIQPSKKAA